MSLVKEFREFAVKGNVIDVAVGIIIGAAFGTVANSVVNDVLMPPIGVLLGGVDFSNFFIVLREGTAPGPYASLAAAQEAGAATLNYGLFINAVVAFLITAVAVFVLVKSINRMRRQEEAAPSSPTDKSCQFCATSIPLAATRCPNCTSELAAV